MSERHTIVVGGGVIGACAAYYLARRGARVTLLERERIAAGASYGNAGLIALGHLPMNKPGVVGQALRWMFDDTSPLYIEPRLDPGLIEWLWRFHRACTPERLEVCMRVLADLGHATSRLFDELIEQERIACGFHRIGYMDVFRTAVALERAERDLNLVRSHGFEVSVLRGEELYTKEPALAPTAVGALWFRRSAHCNPHQFVREVVERARHHGAAIREHTDVADVVLSGGSVRGVRIGGGEIIPADVVVLCAGAWTARISRRLGLRLCMQPAKGYHRDVHLPASCITTPCVLGEEKVAITPMNGFLRLAGTLELSGINDELRPERLDALTEAAARYMPEVAGAEPLSEWCGLRPCTPDGLPIVGWAPGAGGLFIATGHAMMGLAQAPITGKLVEECVLDGRASLDIEPMRADRFV